MKDRVNQQERLPKSHPLKKQEMYFLGGLFEGGGSFQIHLKKSVASKFQVTLDPIVNFSPHFQDPRAMHYLERMKVLFGAGKIEKRGKPKNSYQLVIRNRRSILEKVIPFYRKYVYPFFNSRDHFLLFQDILEGLGRKEHLEKRKMISLVQKTYEFQQLSGTKAQKEVRSLESWVALVESSETTRLTS